jgi:Tol biopolymer transport system component
VRLGVAAAVALAVVGALLIATKPWHDSGKAAAAQKASFDSLAPVRAPAHWLPPEDWVYNHWLPYDEGRLYALLGVTRGDIWRQLRDDRHTIAELAAKHGWPDPAKLARALVEPRRAQVSPHMLAVLRSRALRTITQGHLSQHLLFHSLHQFAIPSEAPDIFGVTDAEFRALRRGEQSPLDIGRVHGRSPAEIQALAAGVLRERVRAGISTGATTPQQGRLLLARQLAQLPRWLAQVRYNGPPPTHEGQLVRLPRDFAANPAVSGDGRHVVFEAYLQKLPLALARGEISVQARGLDGSAPIEVSKPNSGQRRGPRSAYNPSVSADGNTVAFESAEGNRNFAKRYGSIRVLVHDVAAGVSHTVGRPGAKVSQSEFNPVVSSDGTAVAYQAVRRTGHSQVLVTRVRSRHTTLVSRRGRSGPAANADTYEPSIDGDGLRIAFTSAAPNLGARGGHSQVFVRDLRSGTTRLVSDVRGYASSPSMSADGRYVAFVAGTLGKRATRILLHDMKRNTTVPVSVPRDGVALGPSVSANGRYVAYTSIARARSSVVVRKVARAGPVAQMFGAEDPSISADGRRVAFSSTEPNIAAGKPDDRRGVFVRDIRTGRTRLVSARVVPGPKPPAAAGLPGERPLHLRARQVAIVDNAFHRGSDRPTVELRAGQRLTWVWRSRQSHQVLLATPGRTLRSPTRTYGRFSVRLTRPGTYDFVCSIHAPGMHMTAIVR